MGEYSACIDILAVYNFSHTHTDTGVERDVCESTDIEIEKY